MCSSRALSRLRSLFHVGAWCLDPGTLVLFRLSSGSCRGSDTHAPGWSCCGLEFARAVRSSVRVCYVLLHAACVFSLAACFHVCHVLFEHAAYEFSH